MTNGTLRTCRSIKGPREQTNQQTAFIDLSNVYSVNQFEGRKILRDIAGGYLRSPTEADGRYMLLRNMDPNDGCNTPEMLEANTPCFKSGNAHSLLVDQPLLSRR